MGKTLASFWPESTGMETGMTKSIPQQRSRLFYNALIFSGFLLVTCLAVTLLGQNEQQRIVLIDTASALISSLAAIALLYAAKQSAVCSHRLFLAWVILAIGMVSYAIGDICWATIEVIRGQPPFPSIADLFYLPCYPLFLIGIILLPTKIQRRTDWIKTFLDMSVVMLAAVLVFLNFLLEPLAAAGQAESIFTQALSIAYPVGDLALLWAVLVILYRRSERQPQAPVLLLSASIIIMIVTDSIFSYQSLIDTYSSGRLLDLGWIASYLLIGLAGIWQAVLIHPYRGSPTHLQDGQKFDPIKMFSSYLPYAWLAGAYLLLVWSYHHSLPMDFVTIAWGVAALIALVLIRQVVTLSENTYLYVKLQDAMERVRQQSDQLSQANQELQVEIDERRKAEEQLAYDALHDALTGLPNRALFMDRLRHAIEYTKRHEDYRFTVLFLDIDHFKVINDSLGHSIGDELLIAFAQGLRMSHRLSDTVARLGGDEFVILLEDTVDQDDAIVAAYRILDRFKLPFSLEGRQTFITASIGIVFCGNGYDQAEDILRDADIAMYHAKSQGKARFELFHAGLRDMAINRLELENDLRNALKRSEFILHYQPILSLKSNDFIGFEALIRWNHPQRGLLRPVEFIHVAEETGLIIPIGEWVLYEGCRQILDWQAQFPKNPPYTININISGVQLNHPDFVSQIERVLRDTGLDGNSLKLEITESVCVNSAESVGPAFRKLSEMGVQFHIDDFGIGYSSLSYLQQFPIHMIKIDRVFVSKMDGSKNNSEIVRSIVDLAHDLGMDAIAEGVETESQLKELKRFGCNYGQGYLLSYPIDQMGIERLLKRVPSA